MTMICQMKNMVKDYIKRSKNSGVKTLLKWKGSAWDVRWQEKWSDFKFDHQPEETEGEMKKINGASEASGILLKRSTHMWWKGKER